MVMKNKLYRFLCIIVCTSMLFGVAPVFVYGAEVTTERAFIPCDDGLRPTIFIAGDSATEQYAYSVFPREGWGMEFTKFFEDGVTVVNKAKGGKSSRTFLTGHDPTVSADYYDTRMQDIADMSKKGDYLLVHLGGNDANNSRESVLTDPFKESDNGDYTSYRHNLRRFIDFADENQINLIFVTECYTRKFGSDGKTIEDGVGNHTIAMKEVAAQYGIPLADMRTKHRALLDKFGPEYSKQLFMHADTVEYPESYPSWINRTDNTHLSQFGAHEISKMVVQCIKEGGESGNETFANLYKYIDKTKDISTVEAPKTNTYDNDFDVTNIQYNTDGKISEIYHAGEVSVSAKVKNTKSTQQTFQMYSASYKGNVLKDVSKSEPVVIGSGSSKNVSVGTVNVPDEGKLKNFVWSENLAPVSMPRIGDFTLTAHGYNRRAMIKWTEQEYLGDDITFEVYRDGYSIGKTQGGGFADENVTRGEHLYQVNAIDTNGNTICRSNSAVATVTSMYDTPSDVIYTKAFINTNGETENIGKGLQVNIPSPMYTVEEAKQNLEYLTDVQLKYATDNNISYFTKRGDGAVRTIKVTDSLGVTKTAWHSSKVLRCGNATETTVRNCNIHFNITDNTITSSDSTVTMFVEFLSNRDNLVLQYCNYTIEGETIVTTDTNGGQLTTRVNGGSGKTGNWRIAKFDITDAYFDHTSTGMADGKADFRFPSDGKDLYISSIMVVKGASDNAVEKYASFTDHNFSNDVLLRGSKLYPDGVSVDFSNGTPQRNGIREYYRTSGTPDALGAIEMDDDGEYYLTSKYIVNANGSLKTTYLYFDVDDRYIFGKADNTVEVEMTYKAEYDETVNVLCQGYDPDNDVYSVKNIALKPVKVVKNNGEWVTVKFLLEGVSFISLDNGGSDFRMYIPGDVNDPNKYLKIRKLVVRNAGGMSRQVMGENVHPKVFIASASQSAYYSSAQIAKNGVYGWGMMLPNYLTDDVTVVNKGVSGTSTKTFPHMEYILNSANKGDYVLIGFGHNDSVNDERGVTVEQYKQNLTKMISDVRNKGAIPVLFTEAPRFLANEGTYESLEESGVTPYRDAMKIVAKQENVPFADVCTAMCDDEKNHSADELRSFYADEGYNNRIHFTNKGADYVASLTAKLIKEQTENLDNYIAFE